MRRRRSTMTHLQSGSVAVRPQVAAPWLPTARFVAFSCTAMGGAFLWSFWTTMAEMVSVWNREIDYSHGYLVVPIAALLLWVRRDSFPWDKLQPAWTGLLLLAVTIGVRHVSARLSFASLDGYSLILWLMAVAWTFGGWAVCRWCFPVTVFLGFMVPLPFRIEQIMSVPLQKVAASISAFVLQCLGRPAFVEETTILLGAQELHVENSCSGLRIFVATFALAAVFAIASRCEVWEKAVLLVSAIPIALSANSLRIVGTALLYESVSGEAARRFSHDISGWLMIPVAAGLLAGLLLFLRRLVPELEPMEVDELVQLHQSVS